MSLRIDVQVACEDDDLPEPRRLRAWAAAALGAHREDAEMTVRIVGEAEGRSLNETYRGRAGPTNVLAFPFETPVPAAAARVDNLVGDVVVCAPVVRVEAREQAKPEPAHFAHLVIHGTLHLLGFDHDRPDDARRMECEERRLLAGLGYPDPYRSDPEAEAHPE